MKNVTKNRPVTIGAYVKPSASSRIIIDGYWVPEDEIGEVEGESDSGYWIVNFGGGICGEAYEGDLIVVK